MADEIDTDEVRRQFGNPKTQDQQTATITIRQLCDEIDTARRERGAWRDAFWRLVSERDQALNERDEARAEVDKLLSAYRDERQKREAIESWARDNAPDHAPKQEDE